MFSTASLRDDMRYTANEPFSSFFANARDRLACKFAITPCRSSELRFSNGQKFRAGGTFPDVKKNTRPLSDTSRVLGFWLLSDYFSISDYFFDRVAHTFWTRQEKLLTPTYFFLHRGTSQGLRTFVRFGIGALGFEME